MQCRSAAIKTNAVLGPNVPSEVFFELGDVGSETKRTVVQSARNRRIQVFAEAAYLRRQVEIRNGLAHLRLIFVEFASGINPNSSASAFYVKRVQ
jgi:hypothetical protein